jgi:hypothetical protein
VQAGCTLQTAVDPKFRDAWHENISEFGYQPLNLRRPIYMGLLPYMQVEGC